MAGKEEPIQLPEPPSEQFISRSSSAPTLSFTAERVPIGQCKNEADLEQRLEEATVSLANAQRECNESMCTILTSKITNINQRLSELLRDKELASLIGRKVVDK